MRPAGIEPTFSSGRDGLLQTTGSKIPFDLKAALPRPLAWAGAVAIELLLVAMLVFLARGQSYSLPEPIPVGIILEQAPPPAAPAPPMPDQPRGLRSGATSGDSDKTPVTASPSAGVANAEPAETPPTPAAPPNPTPPTPASSAPIEPSAKGRQAIPAAPLKSPATSSASVAAKPKPSPNRAPLGRQVDLTHVDQGSGDTYLNELRAKLAQNRIYPEQARALGLTGTGIFRVVIARSGQLLDVKVLKSTGAEILDDAQMESIRQSSPFPPFPDYIRTDAIEVLCTALVAPP